MHWRAKTHRTIRTASAVLSCIIVSSTALAVDDYVTGQVLVAPRAGEKHILADTLIQMRCPIVRQGQYTDVMAVAVPPGNEVFWMEQLRQAPGVAYAELNGIGSGGAVPNDTHFGSQWHLLNSGQSGGTINADIDADEAWDITTGSTNIVIAVLDTGIDSDQPDFAGRIDPDGMDFVNTDNDPEADHPHGTHVAGCIAANANDSYGVAGVDWNCKILPIKVLNSSNLGTTLDLAEGLNYVATQADVQIVNMSLINYPFQSTTLENAMQNCRNAGQVLIACAGNGGIGNADVSWPGGSTQTIAIGATTRLDTRASFSGTGVALDFVAPGLDIATVNHGSAANSFDLASGCSFATPITAGAVGLLFAYAETLNVTLDQDLVYQLLQDGAEDEVGPPGEDTPGEDNFFGHGRINIRDSLDELPLLADCDENGTLDTIDIMNDPLRDVDGNGTLDECEMPSNNDCIDGPLVFAGSTLITTNGAMPTGPTEACGDFESDVWFRFTVSATDIVNISLENEDFDGEIALYTFTCPSTPSTALECANGSGPMISTMLTPSLYRIRVSGNNGETGTGDLVLSFGVQTPPCPWDCAPDNGDGTFGNGTINIDDLLQTINAFGGAGGPCDNAPDNGDGTFGNNVINIDDILGVINNFGACPS
ncbi:MAG: S8 family serine peptidase [Planctomycetota bacterium]